MSQQLNNESQKRYRNKAYFANTDKPRTDVSQIITSLEQDFSSFLKQDENRYQEYLRTMARFHKYSVNNSWSENHTPHELKNSLFIIRRTADSLINKICEKVNTQDHVNS